jgi:beta-N-acetylhexosaminidase
MAEEVTVLGRAMAEGLLAGGVLPVVKHMPGHGRADVDSHHGLPVVRAGLADLERVDLAPFRAMRDMPAAMTAHVVFAAIDADRPCTTSPVAIERLIRGAIGFQGLLIGDDLSMGALGGDLPSRVGAALAAGCDIVLHCNGRIEEMASVAAATPPLAGASGERAETALARLSAVSPSPDDPDAEARFDAWLATLAA